MIIGSRAAAERWRKEDESFQISSFYSRDSVKVRNTLASVTEAELHFKLTFFISFFLAFLFYYRVVFLPEFTSISSN